ncbi:MAG TPA: leucine-rich repeat domain-containing protein, partial [Archangium sp.]|nr:leucine-rich repeat domain-containing protein [Archangium sp.]
LDTLPADSIRLLVRGQAGSGKSTLFRWAAMTAALETKSPIDERLVLADASEKRQGTWRTRVPFLLRLRSCTDGRLPALEGLTLHTAPELGKAPEGWVRAVLNDGRALLLIDGVDEVPRHLRHTVEEEVGRFVNTYPRCSYLLSTRPTAVPPGWLKHLGFRDAEVTPLSVLDRERLIDHWHRAVTLKLEKVGDSAEDLPALAQELKATLRRGPTIARLTTTPLLTAVICALHRERNQRLPETLDELCEALCQMLLHRRELESLDLSGFPEVYRKLSYPDKKNILRALAYDMVLNGRSELDKDRAQQEVGQMVELLGKSRSDGPAILEGLIERSGMLREPGPEKVDFIHNTFKEYLAAEVFTERGHDGLLARNILDPDWKPVLVFAVMRGSESFNASLIQQVLSEPRNGVESSAKPAGGARERQLMAVLLEASARRLRKEEREHVAKLRERLFPPTTMAEAEILASAGDDIVPFLRYRKKLTVRMAAACVRTLRLIGSAAAQEALKGYLNETRWTVVEELALAIEPLEIKLVRQALLAGNLTAGRIRVQIRDVNQLFAQDEIRASLFSLQSLNLSGTQVQDLKPLAALSSLQSLNLRGTQVQDLKPLAALTSLQSLDLRGTQVQDLKHLEALASLKSLYLDGPQVQDIQPLETLASLQSLYLVGPQVQDLKPLEALSSLTNLDLLVTQVQALKSLAALASLRNLYLILIGPQLQDLSPLSTLASLQSLSLYGRQVQDLSPLSTLTSLQNLDLHGTQVQDLSPLSTFTSLQNLDLTGTQVEDLSPISALMDKGLRVVR